jgi:endogenous inhibitor of DNA gyrase (YacG/DUF329 family)
MTTARCPLCGKTFHLQSIDDWPQFPFCSERCRLLDLGRWLDGSYAIPGREPQDEDDPDNQPDRDN